MLTQLIKELHTLANPERAKHSLRYFKTGPGQYGEGDVFLGITVPEQRRIAKKYEYLPLDDVIKLLHDKIHDYRQIALFILISYFKKNPAKVYNLYFKNIKYINNWDLVDTSAYNIVGHYLLDKDRSVLYKLAKSSNLWEKRIAIVSTFEFIRNNQLDDTLKISEILLTDKHDLIHKAVGWMLREIGKKNEKVLTKFLDKHLKEMPRTMLRYSIERFEERKRQHYLKKE